MSVTDKSDGKTVGKPTFVYIVGKGHSGSTILESLLNRSAKVAAMGEIDMLALQIYRDIICAGWESAVAGRAHRTVSIGEG